MTIYFTEEEKEYIVKELFNWHISENCPESIRKMLEPKLKLLKSKQSIMSTRN